MANGATSVYTKAQKVAGTALGLLQRDIVLGNLVSTKGVADFRGASDDTIDVPIRATTVADVRNMRATGEDRKINVRDLQESKVQVRLSKVVENVIGVTDEQATLDVVDFSEQVVAAQLTAVAQECENQIATVMRNAKYHANNGVTWNTHEESSPRSGAFGSIVRANVILNKWNVPTSGRIMVVGPAAYGEILLDKRLDSANPEGLKEGGLRDAYVGRLAGTTIVQSNLLNDNEAYLFHKSAFVFANVAPVVPRGAYGGSSKEYAGFSLRWLMDYDATYGLDRSVLTTYTGGASTEDGPTSSPLGGGTAVKTNVRAVKLTLVNDDPTPNP